MFLRPTSNLNVGFPSTENRPKKHHSTHDLAAKAADNCGVNVGGLSTQNAVWGRTDCQGQSAYADITSCRTRCVLRSAGTLAPRCTSSLPSPKTSCPLLPLFSPLPATRVTCRRNRPSKYCPETLTLGLSSSLYYPKALRKTGESRFCLSVASETGPCKKDLLSPRYCSASGWSPSAPSPNSHASHHIYPITLLLFPRSVPKSLHAQT